MERLQKLRDAFWDKDLEPKLVTVLREGYTREQLLRDLLAGVVVGVVALPLAIAFAIASGVRPEQGLFTAIIAGFIISMLSGSRVQIGGPTGAFIVIVYSIVVKFGYEGLAIATMMAGIILIIMAFARLGAVIRFIPYPVTVGFTSGIAVLIASSQIRDAFGLSMTQVPSEFLEKWVAYTEHFSSMNGMAVALCVATIVIAVFWSRITVRIPGPLVALVATTVIVTVFDLKVETIGSRFGSVPHTLPVPHWPQIEWKKISSLVSPAISIALLGGIESLLSALVADGMTGRRHRSNAELLGQGVANLVVPFFSGIPATGAIARTATNIKNGGRTPLAGIVHAFTLLLILLVAAPLAELIPMATLAGILLVVSYNMSEWHVFVRLLRGPRSDVLVLLTTFLLTVIIDLTVAIQAGVVLASLLFMRRMTEVTQIRAIRYEESDAADRARPETESLPGVEIFEINGSFCFGAAQKFSEVISQMEKRPQVVILQMRDVLAMDATGMQALEEVATRFRRQGTALLLASVNAQPLGVMRRSGFFDMLGAENVLENFSAATERAKALQNFAKAKSAS